MISLSPPSNVVFVKGQGWGLDFDTTVTPDAALLKRGQLFMCGDTEYKVLSISRTQYLTSPPILSTSIGIVARKMNE